MIIKPCVTDPMFTSWFEANKKFLEARELTYGQFIIKFVFVKRRRTWKPRKKAYNRNISMNSSKYRRHLLSLYDDYCGKRPSNL